jgi:hypothetical protein
MSKSEKDHMVIFRIENFKKEKWKKFCSDKNISLSSLIINSVEGKILENDRRQIIAFIEKQDNLFVKIETNINQVAKIVNGQKFISEIEMKNFSSQLLEIAILKKKQNEMFEKIYSMLAK